MTTLGKTKVALLFEQLCLWNNFEDLFSTEGELIAAAFALGADTVKGLSAEEIELEKASRHSSSQLSNAKVAFISELIRKGHDPLGAAFCALRSSEQRRGMGATYTPEQIVQAMIAWAASTIRAPERIVDPGVGSGRFLAAAGARFRRSELVGIDVDPVAALMARANIATLGLSGRARILVGDYRRFHERAAGTTLYVGNPPYVRHHQISSNWKDWLFAEAAEIGLSASKLAGLHVHFLLATARNAKEGDLGAFITSAEWLDVNYGALVRSLFLNYLGGKSITLVDPTATAFPDAATTAAITTFEIGAKTQSISFRRIESL
jgi:predicted RNA methylase